MKAIDSDSHRRLDRDGPFLERLLLSAAAKPSLDCRIFLIPTAFAHGAPFHRSANCIRFGVLAHAPGIIRHVIFNYGKKVRSSYDGGRLIRWKIFPQNWALSIKFSQKSSCMFSLIVFCRSSLFFENEDIILHLPSIGQTIFVEGPSHSSHHAFRLVSLLGSFSIFRTLEDLSFMRTSCTFTSTKCQGLHLHCLS